MSNEPIRDLVVGTEMMQATQFPWLALRGTRNRIAIAGALMTPPDPSEARAV